MKGGGGQGQGVQFCTYKLNVYNWGGGGQPAYSQLDFTFYVNIDIYVHLLPYTERRNNKINEELKSSFKFKFYSNYPW
jgi:hypothetical protein